MGRTALMKGYHRQGDYNKVDAIFHQLQQDNGIIIDSYALNTYLDSLTSRPADSKNATKSYIKKAFDVFEFYQDYNNANTNPSSAAFIVDVTSYTIIISSLFKLMPTSSSTQ